MLAVHCMMIRQVDVVHSWIIEAIMNDASVIHAICYDIVGKL